MDLGRATTASSSGILPPGRCSGRAWAPDFRSAHRVANGCWRVRASATPSRTELGSNTHVSPLHQRVPRMALVAARRYRSSLFSHTVCFILLLATGLLEGRFLGASVHSRHQQCHSCSQRRWSRNAACLTTRCSESRPAPMRNFRVVNSSRVQPRALSGAVADLVSR
jgi:hypothetical protein